MSSSAATVPLSAAPLRIKVCGMRQPENILAVGALEPDFLGFIFYPKSKRQVPATLTELPELPASCRKVGVFVDESTANIRAKVTQLALDLVQLHGHESPAQCAELQAAGIPVIKAFSVDTAFDFAELLPYVPSCSFFLFDTKGEQPGGNGTAFDWNILRDYALPVPYFLAGGLDLEHAQALRELQLPGLYAVDLNSRFETQPGLKDAARLAPMFHQLRA